MAAGHRDLRAKAAISLDGGNWDPSLIDTQIRTPLLTFHQDTAGMARLFGKEARIYPQNSEFVYEKLEQYGQRDDVVRVEIKGTGHWDFSDYSLTPIAAKQPLQALGVVGSIDGARQQALMNDFVKAFFDRHILGKEAAFPSDLFRRYPEADELESIIKSVPK